MEFLGDAVLDLIVANYLYKQNKEWNEGELTVESDKLVSGATLAKIAAQINLDRYLIIAMKCCHFHIFCMTVYHIMILLPICI